MGNLSFSVYPTSREPAGQCTTGNTAQRVPAKPTLPLPTRAPRQSSTSRGTPQPRGTNRYIRQLQTKVGRAHRIVDDGREMGTHPSDRSERSTGWIYASRHFSPARAASPAVHAANSDAVASEQIGR